MFPIPFNQPSMVGNEFAYIQQAIQKELRLSGDGPFSKKVQAFLESMLNIPKVLLTTSCTDALEMCALLLNLQPGDEVIVPSFTFVSTANAFALHGARPVFVDVRPDTLNLDEGLLAQHITPRTKAIVVVHYAGVACEMQPILEIAKSAHIPIIEDNAHGLFGRYQQHDLGTLGAMATLSFHETKNITCGEGGALLLNDPLLVERAEIIREKGTNRNRFFRGQVDKYTWVDIGSSYLLSDLAAAFLYAQLEHWESIQAKRHSIWQRYYEGLSPWATQHQVGLPHIPAHCQHSAHLFYLMMPSLEQRQAFIQYLDQHQVNVTFHYQPLHLSSMGQRFGGQAEDYPVTERAGDCLVRLPFFFALTPQQQDYIIEAIGRFVP
jgi:dTDP-4-amino-4,6-dideoxygalactose transaminase